MVAARTVSVEWCQPLGGQASPDDMAVVFVLSSIHCCVKPPLSGTQETDTGALSDKGARPVQKTQR